MRIAIIGAGRVGKSLGMALHAKARQIVYGVREPQAPGECIAKSVDAAIAGAEVVILATPWTATEAMICEHAPALAGKIVIDATNPLNADATRLTLGFDSSGVERLQSHVHGATFFKAFNAAGIDVIAKPLFPQGRAAMFVAGPKGAEKEIVLGLVSDVGFEAVDAGELRVARLLEPLGMLQLQLEGRGQGRDVAFVLASRALNQPQAARPGALAEVGAPETRRRVETDVTKGYGRHSGAPVQNERRRDPGDAGPRRRDPGDAGLAGRPRAVKIAP